MAHRSTALTRADLPACAAVQARALAALLGLGVVLPWAAGSASLPYISPRFPGVSLPFVLNAAYCAPFLPVPLLLMAAVKRYGARGAELAVPASFVILAAALAGAPLAARFFEGTTGVAVFAVLAGVLPGVLSNVAQTAIFAVNSNLSPELNPWVWAGQGAAGVIASAAMVVDRLIVSAEATAPASGDIIFFGFTAAVSVACAAAWIAYRRHPYITVQLAARARQAERQASLVRFASSGSLSAPPRSPGAGGRKEAPMTLNAGGAGEEVGGSFDNEEEDDGDECSGGDDDGALSFAGRGGDRSDAAALTPLLRVAASAPESPSAKSFARAARLTSEASYAGLLPRLWDLWLVLVINFGATFLVLPFVFLIPYTGGLLPWAPFTAGDSHAWWSTFLFACYNIGDCVAYFSRVAGLRLTLFCGPRKGVLLAVALVRLVASVAGFLALQSDEGRVANDFVAAAFVLAFGFSSGFIESSAMFHAENSRRITSVEGRSLVGTVSGLCVVFGLFWGGALSYVFAFIPNPFPVE